MKAFTFRDGREVRRFDDREDELLTRLWRAGAGTTEIAKAVSRLGRYRRTSATINMRLKTLGLRVKARNG